MTRPKQPATGYQPIDDREHAGSHIGKPETADRRLFMQLLAFSCENDLSTDRAVEALRGSLTREKVTAVLYANVNDPRGLAVLTFSDDPVYFVRAVRPALSSTKLTDLRSRPELTMIGRSYATGFEQDLEHSLIDRPRQTVLNGAWPWAVWYPLRRTGAFARLSDKERGHVLSEHAAIGRAYGEQDLAHDVRLACHGLDNRDNEFVIGLVGRDLHPLSHVVQAMRTTQQTARYISQMGPFFVGHVLARVCS